MLGRPDAKSRNDAFGMHRLNTLVGSEYCLMSWAHETRFSEPGINFGLLPVDVPLHCDSALRAKEAEIHALAWKLAFELRRRR